MCSNSDSEKRPHKNACAPPYSKNPPNRRLSQCLAEQIGQTHNIFMPTNSVSASLPPILNNIQQTTQAIVHRKPLQSNLYARNESLPYSNRSISTATSTFNSFPPQTVQALASSTSSTSTAALDPFLEPAIHYISSLNIQSVNLLSKQLSLDSSFNQLSRPSPVLPNIPDLFNKATTTTTSISTATENRSMSIHSGHDPEIFEIPSKATNNNAHAQAHIYVCKLCRMGYEAFGDHFIESHESSDDHVNVKNGDELPEENVSKDVRLIVPRRVVVDVVGSKRRYVCVPCKVTIERNVYKVKLHLESNIHKSKNIQISPNELMTIDEYNLTNVEILVNKKKDLFFLESHDRSEKFAEVICKLCSVRLKIEWHRSESILSHERTDKHKELLKLKQVYQHLSLSFQQLRTLHKRNKVLEHLAEAEQDIKHFKIVQLKEPNGKFPDGYLLYCKCCEESVATYQVAISHHLQLQHHKNCLPKSDGFSDYEYNMDLIKMFIAGKHV